jgi:hypothetical protein
VKQASVKVFYVSANVFEASADMFEASANQKRPLSEAAAASFLVVV